MSKLDELRRDINEVDRQMCDLFVRRMEIAGEVAAYKKANGMHVLDAAREARVLEDNLKNLANDALSPYYADYLRGMMALSRAWQAKLLGQNTVAYQGAAGSFQHTVATALYPHAELLVTPTFEEVFEAVESGRAAFGVVPFENSSTGDVSGVLDMCYRHKCYIYQMVDLPVQQNLLALPGAQLADIKKIYSHPQGLAQCMRFIQSLGAQPVEFANTALAAEFVAKQGDKSLAAISGLAAGEAYGLVPLAADISTEEANTTRFIIISEMPATVGDRFSLLVTIENKVGTLERIISAISAEGLNMESIKSRPMPKRPWEYYFYIELVGSPDAEATERLLARIGEVCVSARSLGCYTRTVLEA